MSAYNQLQPFGSVRSDLHHARTQALLSNWFSTLLYAMGRTRERKHTSPADYMYKPIPTEADKLKKLKRGMSSIAKRR